MQELMERKPPLESPREIDRPAVLASRRAFWKAVDQMHRPLAMVGDQELRGLAGPVCIDRANR